MFDRLKALITPPPSKKERPAPPFTPPPDPSSKLRPLLDRLVAADSLTGPVAQEAFQELKQLALRNGLYVTAFSIKNRLDAMSRIGPDGTPIHKSQGYLLAADFIFGHVKREVAGLKDNPQAVGPNAFREYCNEMIVCLLNGENVRRAVEIPVLLIDDLLVNAINIPGRAMTYLGLVVQAAQAITELTTQWRHHGKSRKERPSGQEPPENPVELLTIDEPLVQYVRVFERQLDAIAAGFSQVLAARPVPGGPNPAIVATPETLAGLVRAAYASGYAPLMAELNGHPALNTGAALGDEAAARFRQAAEWWEQQGDAERGLFLTKLCAVRYQKARDHYLRSGDQAGVARVQAKMAQGAPPPSPRGPA